VRVHHKPFVNWIWIGCLLMAFGGALAVLDRRYRARRAVAAAPVAPPARAADASPAQPVLASKAQLQ
jgi:cytochrome c-type biogenesis protein CcmF